MMNDFASSARLQLDAMHEFGQVADEGMAIAVDMHLIIPRWDKKVRHLPDAFKKKEQYRNI